jgi:hypothetical protein
MFRPNWPSSGAVFLTRQLLLPRVISQVGIALQPWTRPNWPSSGAVFFTRQLLLPRVISQIGIALQPWTCSVLPVVSYIKVLSVVHGLVCEVTYRFVGRIFLFFPCVAVLHVFVCCIRCTLLGVGSRVAFCATVCVGTWGQIAFRAAIWCPLPVTL